MNNKLYAQCREEARKLIAAKYSSQYLGLYLEEYNQLTAEIYGMKLLDMTKNLDIMFNQTFDEWEYFASEETIGTTQDLHDHFVREFNVSLINEGNNGKQ